MTREEREYAIDIIQSILDKYEEDECLVTEITIGDEDIEALKLAIKALEQETVSKESYDHEYFLRKDFELKIDKLQRQLDKIRAEIMALRNIRAEEFDIDSDVFDDRVILRSDVLEILDKYKAESENP